jgi:tetratricopeptide (TPR) repeat protein
MYRSTLFSILIAVLVLIATVGPASAQGTFGRLLIIMTDQDGNPVPGVTATATCDELPNFLETKTTNKKGKVTLAFADGTKVYNIKLEYPGSPPLEMPFKPEIRKTITQEMTIDLSGGKPEVSAGDSQAGGELTLTPTERIFNSGVELLQAEEYEAAREKFLEAINNRPNMAVAYSALGGVELQLGNPQAALEAANTLLELEPENPRGFRILYEAHRQLGNEGEAKRALAALTTLDSSGDAAIIIFNEGVEALKVGDRSTAKDSFKQALEINPEMTQAMSALAIVLLNDGEVAEAAELAERLLAVEPDNVRAMNIAFDAYKSLGDQEKERATFDRILASGSKDIGRLLYESGVELFNSGNLDGALKNFEQALEADGSLAKAHYHLGLCLVNKGDVAGAKEHFNTFLEMTPDDPEAPAAIEMLKALG